ncbi:hypothetical protein [Weissella confusa]|nr:hypothetical protein [Weissella confusa]
MASLAALDAALVASEAAELALFATSSATDAALEAALVAESAAS